jgi:UDP-N-acetyl-D-galactosamine dehydrogenase
VDEADALSEYGLRMISKPKNRFYDGIIIAVAHEMFIDIGIENIRSYGKKDHVIYDIKYLFKPGDSDIRL